MFSGGIERDKCVEWVTKYFYWDRNRYNNSDNLEKEFLAKDFIRKGCKNRNFTKTFTSHKNKVERNFH